MTTTASTMLSAAIRGFSQSLLAYAGAVHDRSTPVRVQFIILPSLHNSMLFSLRQAAGRRSPTYAAVKSRTVQCKWHFVGLGSISSTRVHAGSPVQVQTPTHWNLTGRSMNRSITRVIAQQYSPTTSVSLRYHSRKESFIRSLTLFKTPYYPTDAQIYNS